MITRRHFVPVATAAATAMAADRQIKVALITHEGGPHLVNYLPSLAGTPEASAIVLADASGTVEAAARKALGPRQIGRAHV